MDLEQKAIEISKMLGEGVIQRGMLITPSITLENIINLFLAEHFCHGNGMV